MEAKIPNNILIEYNLFSQQTSKGQVIPSVSSLGFISNHCLTWPSQTQALSEPLARNVTVSPFVWNVAQPVGTFW